MTELKRTIKRTTRAKVAGRNLVLIIEPPDLVTVREKGRRKGFSLTVEAIYYLAAKAQAEHDRNERLKKRKANRRQRSIR